MGKTVLIGVCTAQRPKMLRRCLDSLAAQQVPDDVSPVLAIIDNEKEPNNQAAVEDFATACPFPVRYIHEPRAGIPIARNRALDLALNLDADWIAFIDDDETAAPDWLEKLMSPEYRHVPVLMGQQILVPPDPIPFWYVTKHKKRNEGEALDTAYTNNVRFHADIVRAGFRFNESWRFTGGSDSEYFARVSRAGYEIRRTLTAKTFEVIHPERLTYRGIFARKYRVAASMAQRTAVLDGKPLWRRVPSIVFNVLHGTVGLCLAVIVFPISRYRFKRIALKSGDKFARAGGRLAALVGKFPEPYRQIDGQ